MRLKGDFTITLSGNVSDVIRRENVLSNLSWYLSQLLTGVECPPDILKPWGIEIGEITLVERVDMEGLPRERLP